MEHELKYALILTGVIFSILLAFGFMAIATT
jgi:hypothetical protein